MSFFVICRAGVWSAGYQPSGIEPDSYEVTFSEDRAEIRQARWNNYDETARNYGLSGGGWRGSPGVALEPRTRTREIELTSYAEMALASEAADTSTRYSPSCSCKRNSSPASVPYSATPATAIAGRAAGMGGAPRHRRRRDRGDLQFETDRARFLGRGHEIRTPISVMDGRPLSGTVGAVIDPILSLRRSCRAWPGATARTAFWTLVAPSRNRNP